MALVKYKSMAQLKIGECMTILVMVAAVGDELYTEIPKNAGAYLPVLLRIQSSSPRVKIELPAGQISHVLHHTFASHFMMNGGNILVLQRILGHTDIKMTMRYSHFAPDHLNDVVMFNPLVRLKNELSNLYHHLPMYWYLDMCAA